MSPYGRGEAPPNPLQGVTKDKGDLLTGTQVGQPVPAEQALAADHKVVAEGRDVHPLQLLE